MASPCLAFIDQRGVLRSERTSCRDVKSRSPWRQVMVQTPSPIPWRPVFLLRILMLISAEIWGTYDGKHLKCTGFLLAKVMFFDLEMVD